MEALVPYAQNARTHSEEQVALIAGSIREFGFTNPVLIDGANGIIAGHGRPMAARKLGLATVPVIELAYLTEAQRKALVLADNKLGERAGYRAQLDTGHIVANAKVAESLFRRATGIIGSRPRRRSSG